MKNASELRFAAFAAIVLLGIAEVSLLHFQLLRCPVSEEKRYDDVVKRFDVSLEEKSFASSKLERMSMYRRRYKYQVPQPRSNYSAIDDLCGLSPDYKTYFSRSSAVRSSNNEDMTIYETYFKGDEELGIIPTKGTVVEIGGYTGMELSNSHFFEDCLGWEAMIVEGNPLLYQRLVNNRPHAHRFSYAPTCSEKEEIAQKVVKFDNYPFANAGLADGSVTTSFSSKTNSVDVPCGSLTKVFKDIFNGHVSLFSLDVEGAESAVLKNLKFDEVYIEIIMIESYNNFCPRGKYCESRNAFRRAMKDNNYILFVGNVWKSDVFIHPLSNHLKTAEKRGLKPTPHSEWFLPAQ